MRLLNVISSVNPEHGGVIEWVRQFGPIAEQLGHEIEVVSLDAPGDPWLHDFPLKVHALGQKFRYFYSPRLVPWLQRERTRYDAVVAHGLWRYPSFGTWRALHGTDTPYFVYTHGMLDPWFKQRYPMKHLGKSLYWPWTDYRALRDARGVIFTCEQEKLKARQSFGLYKARELVTTIGIQAPQDDHDRQLHAFYEQFPETRSRRLILFLGRIHPKKGCDMLVRSFARAAASDERLHLVFAGPDYTSWIPQLNKIAEDEGVQHRITWAGMISGDIKWGAFRAAEAFILPSHQENFGIAVVEAMACGTPVLVSNKVDIFTEVDTSGAGLVADDTQAGTDQLLAGWLERPEAQRSGMAQNARKCFQDKFEVTAATRDLMKMLEQHSGGNGQPRS